MAQPTLLTPGQSAQLQRVRQEDVRVQLSVTGGQPLRLLGILLNEEGRPAGPAPLLTWRSHGNDVQIDLADKTIKAILHTAALQEPIQSIMFVVAPYGRKCFAPDERIVTEISRAEAEPVAFELTAADGTMATLALCDFYRHPEQGAKVRMRGEWRHRELTLLLERLGVPKAVLTEQMLYPLAPARPAGDKYAALNDLVQGEAPAAPAQAEQDLTPPNTAAENPAPPADDIIRLAQAGAQHRLANTDGKFGAMRVHLVWHQRLATRSAVKLDVGCFWEMQDGKKGQLEGLSDQHGSLGAPPFIALTGEMHREGAKCYETIAINGDRWGEIRRVLLYAMIREGPPQWAPLDARVILRAPNQAPVQLELAPENSGPLAALLLLENRGDQVQVTYPTSPGGGCFDSHYALDAAFDFKLRWRKEEPRPRDAASDTEWVQPAPMGFWRKWTGILFGTATYNEAETLMRAALAASSLVMVADGRVTVEDRKHLIEAVMAMPVGGLFAEYEVREGLEKILRDLKEHRQVAERLTLRLIGAFRGSGDAKVIVHAMRAAAMADGQVNLQEERMIERLTRYLKT